MRCVYIKAIGVLDGLIRVVRYRKQLGDNIIASGHRDLNVGIPLIIFDIRQTTRLYDLLKGGIGIIILEYTPSPSP